MKKQKLVENLMKLLALLVVIGFFYLLFALKRSSWHNELILNVFTHPKTRNGTIVALILTTVYFIGKFVYKKIKNNKAE